MILRIVKMTFEPSKVDEFTRLFDKQKTQIRHFPGCTHLELWRHSSENHVFFTYSHWESEQHLEAYRQSDLFRETWAATKILFSAKPAAWSVHKTLTVE